MDWKNNNRGNILGYFLSPLFALIFSWCFCSTLTNIILIFFPQTVSWIAEDWQYLDCLTTFFYFFLFISLIFLFNDFKKDRKLSDYFIYLFLTLAAFAREQGIQHWLASKDSTAIKIRFFTNPDNPLSEKIITVLLLALIVGSAAYVLVKYAKYYIPGFFKMDTLSWSIVTLGASGLFAKLIDRMPNGPISKWMNFGELYGEYLELYTYHIGVFEETAEMLIPINAIIILWQYHLLRQGNSSQSNH